MRQTQFRISFDVPVSHCTSPGYIRQVHAHDFRPQATNGVTSLSGTWQDPLTGLIMLQPSFLNPDFSNNFKGLANWNYAQNVWNAVKRGADIGGSSGTTAASLMTFSLPESTGSQANIIKLATSIALAGVAVSLANADFIEIALESLLPIGADHAFAIHYNTLTDNMHRKKNWFAIVWDRYQVHFSMDGTARMYEYTVRGTYTDTPKLLQEFEIASPGDLMGKDGYFFFIPIPGYGLRLIHSHTPQSLPNANSSARSSANRGVLIPIPTRDVGGFATLFDASKVWIALNPYHPMVLGFQEIVYSTAAASYLDAPFDPGYKPPFAPDDVSAFVSASILRGATLTAALRKPDDSGPWAASAAINTGDRQARVKTTLQTTDAHYTPYLLGYGAKWLPVNVMRATTQVWPYKVLRLEFSDSDTDTFEGQCSVLVKDDDGRRIVERGDTTFLLEYSEDNGASWLIFNGGFAKLDGEVSAVMDASGSMYYRASWRLSGVESVFDEMSQILENAFDGLTPGDGINLVLNACGFPFMDNPLPAALTAVKIPQTPKGQNWRFAPREGDKGDQIIRELLLLVKKQYQEWRIRYDFALAKWVPELRDRKTGDLDTWTFTPFKDEAVFDRHLQMQAGGDELFTFSVTPPECNVVQPFGLTTADQNGERVPGTPLVNKASIDDPLSPDYLGRFKNARPMIGPVSDLAVINLMGRRVYDAAAHRRVRVSVTSRDFIPELKPNTHVKLRSEWRNSDGVKVRGNLFTTGAGASETHLWVKRRTVVLDYNKGAGHVAPTVTYALDSVWDSEL